jgi:hypothetical protein
MPILFMGLIALGVFMIMGLLLFYAAYAEGKAREKGTKDEADLKHAHIKQHAPVA